MYPFVAPLQHMEAPMNYPGEYWIQKVGGTSEN